MKAYSESIENSSGNFSQSPNIVKNFKLKRYNCIPHAWGKLYTPEGKKLSRSSLEVLWTLCRYAIFQKSQEIEIDYAFLCRQSGQEVSHKQMSRYLNDIQSAELIEFIIKRDIRGYKKTLSIKIDFLKIDSLGACLSKGMFTGHTCLPNLGTYNKEENNIEISNNLKERKIDKKKEGADNDINKGAEINCTPEKESVITKREEAQTDLMINTLAPANIPNVDLYKQILRQFPPYEAAEIFKNCKFKIKQAGQMEIKINPEIILEAEDKERLNTCIKNTYGNDIKINLDLSLKFTDFYPLGDKDVRELQELSHRSFNSHFMNQLLTKFSKKYPDKDFPSKEAFFNYFKEVLKKELRSEEKANNLDFTIMSIGEYKINKFLSTIEKRSINDNTPENVLKTKIVSTLGPKEAYELLEGGSINIDNFKRQVIISTSAPLPIPENQREIILKQIASLADTKGGFDLVIIPMKKYQERKEEEHKLPDNIWGEIRKDLIASQEKYTEALDKSWFTKVEAEIDETKKTIELTPLTKFIEDYIRRNYLDDIERVAKSKGFSVKLLKIEKK